MSSGVEIQVWSGCCRNLSPSFSPKCCGWAAAEIYRSRNRQGGTGRSSSAGLLKVHQDNPQILQFYSIFAKYVLGEQASQAALPAVEMQPLENTENPNAKPD